MRNLDVKATVTEKGTGNPFWTVQNSSSSVVKKESKRYSASACWVQECLPEEGPFLQAQWPSPGKLWCRTKYLLLTLGMSSRPAIYSCSGYFHNSGDEHHTVWEHGSPLQKRNSLLWTGKPDLRGLVLKMIGNHLTTMAIFRGLFGVRVLSPGFFCYTQCPTGNSEYWKLFVYSEFDSARNTLNQKNSLTSIFLTRILSLL